MKLMRSIRRGLFVQTFETPNPNSIKLVTAGKKLPLSSPVSFNSPISALRAPLADYLFRVPGVVHVLLAKDYISVNKKPEVEWDSLREHLIDAINDFYQTGKLPVLEHHQKDSQSVSHPDGSLTLEVDQYLRQSSKEGEANPLKESETVLLIKEIIETRIRPFVQEDGGDIDFESFDEEKGIVFVEMKGSCTGCPSSGVTLKSHVETMLVHYVSQVTEVRMSGEECVHLDSAELEVGKKPVY